MLSKDKIAIIMRIYMLFCMQITRTRAIFPYVSKYVFFCRTEENPKTNVWISIKMPFRFNNKCVEMAFIIYHENMTSSASIDT